MSDDYTELDVGETQEPAQMQAVTADAEIERLQAEVAALRQQVAATEDAKAPKRHGGRRFLVGLLIVLGCIVIAGANVALWARSTVLSTNGWVAAVGPLSRNEVIVNTLSVYVVSEVFTEIDVQGAAQEILPPDLGFLSAPLTRALRDVVRDIVADLIMSDQFNTLWVTVNRTAHELIMGALRGGTDLLYLRDGKLTIDLEGPLAFIESTLGLEGLDVFDDRDWDSFVLFESQQVAVLQQILNMLDAIGLLLPILALVLFVIAWLVSLWRRRTVLWIGVGVAVTMVLSLIVLALVRPALLSSILDPLMRAVAGEIWTVVTRGLIWQTILILVVGVLIAVGAALAGPHPRAVAFRSSVRERLGR
jgi:hypothetical protein